VQHLHAQARAQPPKSEMALGAGCEKTILDHRGKTAVSRDTRECNACTSASAQADANDMQPQVLASR
jgi:hypothetical protein